MELILKIRTNRRIYKSKGSIAKRQVKSTKLDESLQGLSLDDLNSLISSLEGTGNEASNS